MSRAEGPKAAFPNWRFPKIRGTFLRVPLIRSIVFGGPILGSLYLGNYQLTPCCPPSYQTVLVAAMGLRTLIEQVPGVHASGGVGSIGF